MPTLEINISLISSFRFAWYYMIISTSRRILLDHAHIGGQHIPSIIESIRLVLHNHEHTLHTPRSCPHWRSPHHFFCRFDSPRTTWSWAHQVAYSMIMHKVEIMIMSMSHRVLLDHAHIRDRHIRSITESIRQVLHDHKHVTLHTPRSCPRWRSPHHFYGRFDSPRTTWSWAHHVAYSLIMPTVEINTSLPLSIRFA
jgi:hypothetical protein